MPRTRRMRSRRRIRRRKRPTTKRLYGMIKAIKNHQELKYQDTDPGDFNIHPTNPDTSLVIPNLIDLGDTVNDRNGNQIWMSSVQLRMHFHGNTNNTSTNEVRYIIFYDRDWKNSNADGTTAPFFSISELLDNTIVTDLLHSPYNMNNYKRFKIFKDKRFAMIPQQGTITAGTTTAFINDAKVFTHHIRLNLPCRYSDSTGSTTDITKGAVVFWATSSASATGMFCHVSTRLYFKDY